MEIESLVDQTIRKSPLVKSSKYTHYTSTRASYQTTYYTAQWKSQAAFDEQPYF